MPGHGEEIDAALAALGAQVDRELSAGGWTRRRLSELDVITMTRSTTEGILAVVEVDRTSFRLPDGWPVEVAARLGVGFDPALNLMPLLTLQPRASLVHGPEHGRGNSFAVELSGPHSVGRAAHRIVQFVFENALLITRDFPDGDAVDAQLQHEVEVLRAAADVAGEQDADDVDLSACDFVTRQRLVVLAAMGRHEEARELLAAFPPDLSRDAIDGDDRRFIRQLNRWLDAGGPVAPPVEQTLAQLPRPGRPPRPSWSQARAETKAGQEALEAVRAQAAGKSTVQLNQVIRTEYAARGIDLAPSDIAVKARMLIGERRPFGRARNALEAIRGLAAVGGSVVHTIRHGAERDPAWLRPPDRASYPVIADHRRRTAVDLDPAAQDWLDRVRAEAPRRMGPYVRVDVWLTHDASGASITAHIGERRVGTVAENDAAAYDSAFRAASLFDEDPFVSGRLFPANEASTDILEIGLPEPPAP